MAPSLRYSVPHLSLSIGIDAIPRPSALLNPSVHLVATESGHAAEFLRAVGLYSAVLALGVDGLQSDSSWYGAEG